MHCIWPLGLTNSQLRWFSTFFICTSFYLYKCTSLAAFSVLKRNVREMGPKKCTIVTFLYMWNVIISGSKWHNKYKLQIILPCKILKFYLAPQQYDEQTNSDISSWAFDVWKWIIDVEILIMVVYKFKSQVDS